MKKYPMSKYAMPIEEPISNVHPSRWPGCAVAVCGVAMFAAIVLAGVVRAAEPLVEPALPRWDVSAPTFGDERNVTLLARLLHEADWRVRQRAAVGLGQTNNPAALEHLEEAQRDTNPAVRIAVIRAVASYPGRAVAERIVINALGEKNPAVVQAVLESVVRLDLSIAASRVAELLLSPNPQIRQLAGASLRNLGLPVDEDVLVKLLADDSAPVVIQALDIAANQPSSAAIIAAVKSQASRAVSPAVRALAIETLARLNFAQARALLARAATSPSPLIRRSAVRAYGRAGQAQAVEAALSDRSAMVRLAASRAITGPGENPAELIRKLFSLMLAAPSDQASQAARDALVRIGGDQVATEAAATMRREMTKYRREVQASQARQKKQKAQNPKKVQAPKSAGKRRQEQLSRNVRACCFILGKGRSRRGFDFLIWLLEQTPLDSPIQGSVVIALGEIGDARAEKPLTKLLERCRVAGAKYLVAMASMSAPPPFSPETTAHVIEALAKFSATSATGLICRLAGTSYMGVRLGPPVVAAMRTLPDLAGPENIEQVEKVIVAVLADDTCDLASRAYAAKAVAKMKTAAALPALRTLLNQERPSLLVMQTAAWAIQEITGQTPPNIPHPKVNQGNWIIKKLINVPSL